MSTTRTYEYHACFSPPVDCNAILIPEYFPEMSTVQCDLLIENGLVIDPANGINQVHFNVAVKDGKILDVFEPDANICVYEAKEKYDASGCYVMPGLIDVHVHCYEHVTSLGINPDDACLARGVTTIVDAGSAGW